MYLVQLLLNCHLAGDFLVLFFLHFFLCQKSPLEVLLRHLYVVEILSHRSMLCLKLLISKSKLLTPWVQYFNPIVSLVHSYNSAIKELSLDSAILVGSQRANTFDLR